MLEPNEELYLSPGLEEYAKSEQREAMEADDREGLVREYLETLLPDNWPEMDLVTRRSFLDRDEMSSQLKGTGDPKRAGELIVKMVQNGTLPKLLPLGSDAVRIIRTVLQDRLDELKEVESFSIQTDYND